MIVAEERILGALADGPLSAREIAERLRDDLFEGWAERHGFEVAWGTDEEPLGARLLAIHEAAENGVPHLFAHQVYPRLRALELMEEVQRIQIPGHRPMLWRLP